MLPKAAIAVPSEPKSCHRLGGKRMLLCRSRSLHGRVNQVVPVLQFGFQPRFVWHGNTSLGCICGCVEVFPLPRLFLLHGFEVHYRPKTLESQAQTTRKLTAPADGVRSTFPVKGDCSCERRL